MFVPVLGQILSMVSEEKQHRLHWRVFQPLSLAFLQPTSRYTRKLRLCVYIKCDCLETTATGFQIVYFGFYYTLQLTIQITDCYM